MTGSETIIGALAAIHSGDRHGRELPGVEINLFIVELNSDQFAIQSFMTA